MHIKGALVIEFQADVVLILHLPPPGRLAPAGCCTTCCLWCRFGAGPPWPRAGWLPTTSGTVKSRRKRLYLAFISCPAAHRWAVGLTESGDWRSRAARWGDCSLDVLSVASLKPGAHHYCFFPSNCLYQYFISPRLYAICSICFSCCQVQLKKCIPYPMAQAFQAAKAVLSRILARPRTGLSLYHLRTLLFWACDRLPAAYLSCPDADTPGRLLLGLLDDLAHCILGKNCPNYFLPQCNMLEHLTDSQALLVARKLAHVRSDPSEHLRAALDQAQQAGQLKKELTASSNGHGSPGHNPANGIISPSEDKLAQRLQQLVTENPGKSISVFLNPDDVTRPHFRIDDKFYWSGRAAEKDVW